MPLNSKEKKMNTALELLQLKLRLPSKLKNWVSIKAKENHRSVNSEINFILEKYKNEQEIKSA